MINRLKLFFNHNKLQDQAIQQLAVNINSNTNHILALARLGFIKPDVLFREANNNQANLDYLTQLIAAKHEEEGPSKENK